MDILNKEQILNLNPGDEIVIDYPELNDKQVGKIYEITDNFIFWVVDGDDDICELYIPCLNKDGSFNNYSNGQFHKK